MQENPRSSSVLMSTRQKLGQASSMLWVLGWAVLMGIAGALSIWLFHEAMFLVQRLLTGQSGEISDVMHDLSWWWRLLLPTIGGLVAGVLLWLAKRRKSAMADDYMEAVTLGDGRLSIRQGLLRTVSSLFTVATGGSIGREGAMIHLASLVASMLGRLLQVGATHLRLLVACGGAAGVSAAYGTPLAGAVFVAEIVLGTLNIQSLGPLLVAAAVANLTMRILGIYQPLYEMPDVQSVVGIDIWVFVLLGVLVGVAAPGFLKLMTLFKDRFARTGIPLYLRLAVGGLLLGLLLIAIPDVAGNGYSVVTALLHEPWAWYMVVGMLFAKVLATALTVGSGAIGGVFTPALFVGAAFGTLCGQLLLSVVPGLSIPLHLFTLVGMGAFLGAATSAPLMAILMLFEMTLSYALVLPLIIATVVAYFVARLLAEVAMYDVVLVREQNERLRSTLRHTQLNELVRPAETVLHDDAKIADALQMFLDYPVKYVYVVDANNIFQGVVAQQDLTRLLLHHSDTDNLCLADVLRPDFVKTLTPSLSLDEAQDYFVNFSGERLPVLSEEAEPRLLGVVYKSALLEKYTAIKRSLDGAEVTAVFNSTKA